MDDVAATCRYLSVLLRRGAVSVMEYGEQIAPLVRTQEGLVHLFYGAPASSMIPRCVAPTKQPDAAYGST